MSRHLRMRLLGPFGLLLASALAGGWLVRHAWNLSTQTAALRAGDPAAAERSAKAATPSSTPAPNQLLGLRIEDLQAQTQREVAMREVAEKKIEALERRLLAREGEVLKSHGRIDEMGQRAAKAILRTLAGAWPNPNPFNMGPAGPLQLSFLRDTGAIALLEAEPVEIARFQAEALRGLLDLEEPASRQVHAFLTREFGRLQKLALTAQFRPTEDPSDFDRRRDAAIGEIAGRLRPLLRGGEEKLKMLPFVLSLGGGFRTRVTVGPDGKKSVVATLPFSPWD